MESPQTCNILLVDDDEDDYVLTKAMLRLSSGVPFSLEWAATPDAGFQAIEGCSYQAVLVDYDLGPMNGVDWIRQAHQRFPRLPLILYSQRSNYEIDLQAMQAGAALYLPKTEASPLTLERSIRYAMDRKKAELEIQTANRLKEEALSIQRTERGLFYAVIDNANACIYAKDKDGRFILSNQPHADLLGCRVQEVIGKLDIDFQIAQPFVGHYLENDQNVFQTGTPVQFRETILHRDGSIHEYISNKFPLRDASGQIYAVCGISTDITESIYLAQKLEWAMEAGQIGFSILDLATNQLETDERALRMHGVENQPPQDRFSTREFVLPEDLARIRPVFEKAIAERSQFHYEYRSRWPDGSLHWIAAWGQFINVGPQGQIITLLQDITSRKQAEATLQTYTKQLKRSNQSLEQFAFVASHDLQEPVRKIETFTKLLLNTAQDRLTQQEQDYLQRAYSGAARMHLMIRELLNLSRITTQQEPFVSVDLNLVAARVLDDLELQIQATGGIIEISPLPQITADEVQMHRLLQNLIGNAIKFHRPNVVPHVRVTGSQDEQGWVEIAIQDNGIGFEEQYAERIFQPFQRLHGRSQYEGSGIGLAVCQKIVERHSGTIIAHSRPDEGTMFILRLPSHQEEITP